MVRRAPLLLLPCVLLAAGGCERHKDIVQAQTANWIEVAGILREVNDAESMEEADRKLMRLVPKFREVARRAKGLSEPSPEVLAGLVEESHKMQSAVHQTQKEIERIKGLPGGPEFFERFNDVFGGPKRVNR